MKIILPILLLILTSCGGGGSAANIQAAPTPTPTPAPTVPLAFGIRGKITGIVGPTSVLLVCQYEMTALPLKPGCYVQGSGYIMDAVVSTDANGNYSFVDIIGTDHRDIRIPIPSGFIWTVAPYFCTDSTGIYPPPPRIYSCAPPSYTFGLDDNQYGGVSGVDFAMTAI